VTSCGVLIQHTGPKLSTYNTGNATKNAAAVPLAHLSRLLMTRTVNHQAKAAKATPSIESASVMPWPLAMFVLPG
jgi:hypothetical protein